MKHVIDYNRILPEFCAQRCSAPSIHGNGDSTVLNPRINYILQLLHELDIVFTMDSWSIEREVFDKESFAFVMKSYHFHNIYLMGTTNCIVTAHHDIVNPNSDNCNDNSASVINAIAAKVLNPNLTVAITDCEEFGGIGAQRVCDRIKEGYFGTINFVLNLELSAVGGRSFFTEKYPNSPLFQKIQRLFPNTPTVPVPFHDGVIMRQNKIDSVVINPLPVDPNTGRMRFDLLRLCHSIEDRITVANYQDMDDFVRYVITPIISN